MNEHFWHWIMECQPGLCARYLREQKQDDILRPKPLPPMLTKLLVAVPACFSLDYGVFESPESPAFDPANAYQGRGYGHEIHYSGGENPRIAAVRESWGRDVQRQAPMMELKFFYGKPPGGYPRDPLPDEVFLDCPDDYASLPLKTVAMARWTLEHNYDVLLKVDDDTLVVTSEIIRELGTFDYAGHMYMSYCSGGAGYYLSRLAMRALDIWGDNPDTWAEDMWVSKVMARAGIKATELPNHHMGQQHWHFGDHYTPSLLPANCATIHACQPHVLREWYAASHHTTALVMICTGEPYWKFLDAAIEGARRYFPGDILLFTDSPKQYPVAKQVFQEQREWPYPTLLRYHSILGQEEWLRQYEYTFYLDVDMIITRPVGSEIYGAGLTVAEHPSYVGGTGTPETDMRSTACVRNFVLPYVCGGFQGGKTDDFLAMARVIAANTDKDTEKGFIAKWHDESHLNHYIQDVRPSVILRAPYSCSSPEATLQWINKKTPLRPAEKGVQIKKDMPK